MYGLRHKHIRIEDQQLNLKMNIMIQVIFAKKDNISFTPIKIFSVGSLFSQETFLKNVFYKQINYLAKLVCSRL